MGALKWARHDDTYYAVSYRGWRLRVDARWAGWQWIIERVGLAGEKTVVGGVEETQREAQDAAISEVDRRMGP
jgi:hypothetical protein